MFEDNSNIETPQKLTKYKTILNFQTNPETNFTDKIIAYEFSYFHNEKMITWSEIESIEKKFYEQVEKNYSQYLPLKPIKLVSMFTFLNK